MTSDDPDFEAKATKITPPVRPAQLDAARAAAAEAGIGIVGVSPYFWLAQDEELLERSFAIAAARRLGARFIRTFTDAGPTGIGSHAATPQHWETTVQALQKAPPRPST
jgi:sugar phosphate isomerase/epimerase